MSEVSLDAVLPILLFIPDYGAKLHRLYALYVSQKVPNVSPKAQIVLRSPHNALILRHGKG